MNTTRVCCESTSIFPPSITDINLGVQDIQLWSTHSCPECFLPWGHTQTFNETLTLNWWAFEWLSNLVPGFCHLSVLRDKYKSLCTCEIAFTFLCNQAMNNNVYQSKILEDCEGKKKTFKNLKMQPEFRSIWNFSWRFFWLLKRWQ